LVYFYNIKDAARSEEENIADAKDLTISILFDFDGDHYSLKNRGRN
jgi:hypothetical protein